MKCECKDESEKHPIWLKKKVTRKNSVTYVWKDAERKHFEKLNIEVHVVILSCIDH